MSLSNIKEGEEKQEDGKRKTHDCGVRCEKRGKTNEAVDNPGKEDKHLQRHGVGYLDTTTQQNTTSAALMVILSMK